MNQYKLLRMFNVDILSVLSVHPCHFGHFGILTITVTCKLVIQGFLLPLTLFTSTNIKLLKDFYPLSLNGSDMLLKRTGYDAE